MNIKKWILIAFATVSVIGATAVVAKALTPKVAVEYYSGHTHDADGTHGAPSHSGGTNKAGCHNGSVPYHCH